MPMPLSSPQPPPCTTIKATFLFLILLPLITTPTTAQACSRPRTSTTKTTTCPPFTSTPPPFPFSSTPGCGHPSFQVQCSSPHSLISINNMSFSLLQYETNSNSLLLSPTPNPTTTTATTTNNCTSPELLSIPNRSITLANSPFRVSDSSCSRLSVLKPCQPPTLPYCSQCSFQCNLIQNPIFLVNECGSTRSQGHQQGCQADILSFLDSFLKWGIEIKWDEEQDSYFSNCKQCQSGNGVCGYNSSDPNKPFVCFRSQTQITPPWIHEQNPDRIAIFTVIFLCICMLVVISIAVGIFLARRKSSASEQDPTIVFLQAHRSPSLLPPVFTYNELDSSTNHFDPKRKLGDGGFGSVYLGQLRNGKLVAVKHLHKHNPTKGYSAKSFCNEILILSSIKHSNLVKLHGYCSDPRGLLLVYEYVPNGTLADHLHGTKSLHRKGPLTWQVRVDIALQTAMAIEYLHFSVVPPIVHRDITSSNIFVAKDMRVKVGDFGLSRLLVCTGTAKDSSKGDSGCVWTGPQGTPGYLDPDYYRSFWLTEKSDIYSFGVVLLELITGMKAVDQRREKREMALTDLAVSRIQMGLLHQVVDPVLLVNGEAVEGVNEVAELAFRCVASEKDDRPDAKEVVGELRRIRSGMGLEGL